jgi:hypothetical protein
MSEAAPVGGKEYSRLLRRENSARRYHSTLERQRERVQLRLSQIDSRLSESEQLVELAMQRRLAAEQERSFQNPTLEQKVMKESQPIRDLEKLEKELRRLDRSFSKRAHVRTLELLAARGIGNPNYPRYLAEYRKDQRTAEAELDVERGKLEHEIWAARVKLATSNQKTREATSEESQG